MFGYSTTLRSMSQGRATYTMEFKRYAEVPRAIAQGLMTERARTRGSESEQARGPARTPPHANRNAPSGAFFLEGTRRVPGSFRHVLTWAGPRR